MNTETDMPTSGPKPWYKSWSAVGAVWFVAAFVVADLFGYNLDGLVEKAANGVMFFSFIVSMIGTVTRKEPLDHSLVLPGVRSETVSKAIDALAAFKRMLVKAD